MARERDTRLVYSTAGPVAPEREAVPASAPEAGKGIRIRLDRRASRRVVTVVSGLPATAEVEKLGRELRSACGAGGTTRGGTIELQGDHRDTVEAALARRGWRAKRAG